MPPFCQGERGTAEAKDEDSAHRTRLDENFQVVAADEAERLFDSTGPFLGAALFLPGAERNRAVAQLVAARWKPARRPIPAPL